MDVPVLFAPAPHLQCVRLKTLLVYVHCANYYYSQILRKAWCKSLFLLVFFRSCVRVRKKLSILIMYGVNKRVPWRTFPCLGADFYEPRAIFKERLSTSRLVVYISLFLSAFLSLSCRCCNGSGRVYFIFIAPLAILQKLIRNIDRALILFSQLRAARLKPKDKERLVQKGRRPQLKYALYICIYTHNTTGDGPDSRKCCD